jgi:hypothetical protein
MAVPRGFGRVSTESGVPAWRPIDDDEEEM